MWFGKLAMFHHFTVIDNLNMENTILGKRLFVAFLRKVVGYCANRIEKNMKFI